jgi:hypothetical protein
MWFNISCSIDARYVDAPPCVPFVLALCREGKKEVLVVFFGWLVCGRLPGGAASLPSAMPDCPRILKASPFSVGRCERTCKPTVKRQTPPTLATFDRGAMSPSIGKAARLIAHLSHARIEFLLPTPKRTLEFPQNGNPRFSQRKRWSSWESVPKVTAWTICTRTVSPSRRRVSSRQSGSAGSRAESKRAKASRLGAATPRRRRY